MMRVGIGYDAHRLVADRKLMLGGVEIPFEKGLLGHSDADVLLHAICDALLGAAALGDIGQHFPDSDPQYKNIASIDLLAETARRIDSAGYRVVNIDCTVMAQAPKLGPFRRPMQQAIARAVGTETDCINVKATTTEGLGFVGRGEGIAAMAVVNITQ